MTLTPYVVTWAVLAVIVVALAIYRNILSLHEDDNLHIAASEQQMIPRQLAFFRMMDGIDRWGKSLTVITFVGGLALLSVYLYQIWESYSRLPG